LFERKAFDYYSIEIFFAEVGINFGDEIIWIHLNVSVGSNAEIVLEIDNFLDLLESHYFESSGVEVDDCEERLTWPGEGIVGLLAG